MSQFEKKGRRFRGEQAAGSSGPAGQNRSGGSGRSGGKGRPAGTGRPAGAGRPAGEGGSFGDKKPRKKKPFGQTGFVGKDRPSGQDRPYGKGRPFGKAKPFRKGPPRKARGPGGDDAESDLAGERLQKVMSAAGIGSRRHCEELIEAGRVDIDGNKAKLGDRVKEGAQIRVDGESLNKPRRLVYYLVNKPDGVVSTNYDQGGRPRVIDLVPQHEGEHLFPVGRLDLSSEGLILVTNDGELANLFTHPRYGVEKTYMALVAGQPTQEVYDKLRQGVHLAEGVAQCASVQVRKALPKSTLLEIVLQEGKNREIRRILAKVGHKVLKLKRVAIGRVKLKDMRPGESRRCTPGDIEAMREAVNMGGRPDRGSRPETSPGADSAGEPASAAAAAAAAHPGGGGRPPKPAAPADDRGAGRFERRPPRPPGKFGDRPQRSFGKQKFGDGPPAGKQYGDRPRFERSNGGGRAEGGRAQGGRAEGGRAEERRPAGSRAQGGRAEGGRPPYEKRSRPPFTQGKRPPMEQGTGQGGGEKRFERKPRYGDRPAAAGGAGGAGGAGAPPEQAGQGAQKSQGEQGGRPSFLPRGARPEGGYGPAAAEKKPFNKRRAKPMFPNRKKRGDDEPPIKRTVIGDE